MDSFTRNYSIVLGVLVIALITWGLYEDPKVSELNALLEQDAELADYPYTFQVLRCENGRAVVSTPRSSEFPMHRALGLLFPRLASRAQNDPDVMKAQAELARLQKRAKALIMDSGKVKGLLWELDKNWLSQRGIHLP